MLQYPSRFIQIVACQMVIQLIMRRVFLPALSWPNSLLGWNIFQCENWARLEWKCTTAVVKIGLLGSNPPPKKKTPILVVVVVWKILTLEVVYFYAMHITKKFDIGSVC